jgi:antitoxin (DNA-binding transcriptional repressor) of toxin-antitoxin stability system
MTTHTVSYFKNHALRLLDDVATQGEELVITRYGKPLAHVEPAKTKDTIKLGKLKGTLEIVGDIVGPLGEVDWDACR